MDDKHYVIGQDTVEVDANVTRHAELELARDDWDVMILHYLGMDHIGHVYGPKRYEELMPPNHSLNNQLDAYSSLMKPKQREMDDVVRNIYERTKKTDEERLKADPNAKPSLIILCGDHGMNEVI